MANERVKSPRVRMFVALDMPDAFLDSFVAWQEQAFAGRRDLRLVPRYSLHVTLVFLGYQFERDIERIAEASFAAATPAFELRPQELVEVPPRRPRPYAVGLDDTGEALGGRQGGLSKRPGDGGFYYAEKHPFWP